MKLSIPKFPPNRLPSSEEIVFRGSSENLWGKNTTYSGSSFKFFLLLFKDVVVSLVLFKLLLAAI